MLKACLFSFCLIAALPTAVSALEVYGYSPGSKKAQPLSREQMESYRKSTHGVPTWLAVVSELNTSNPKVHIIDTSIFDNVESTYGTHQAYSEAVGLSKGDSDYIKKLKSEKRSIMPFTLYVRGDGSWVLQNRRYAFSDSSKKFAASLVKCQNTFQSKLDGLVAGDALFVTYQTADKKHHRPNTMTALGQGDINALAQLGFGVITEDEI